MRRLLLTLLVLLSTPLLAEVVAAKTCPPNFGYSGYMPPSQWRFVPEWKCGTEPLQSPIDIAMPFTSERNKAITISYHPMQVTVKNSGHDFRVIPSGENTMSVVVDGETVTATLDQFHFHTPSEHTMAGRPRAAGELHFVHVEPQTQKVYAIAVLLTSTTQANTNFNSIFARLPLNLCATATTNVDLKALLPATIGTYYRYTGSLTTPACDGDVTFFVLPNPMPMGAQQLETLRRFGDNARIPMEPRNNRPIVYVTP
jgi:carbonic anhydrase